MRLKDYIKRKNIPKDIPYCYTPISYENGVYKIKCCPYYVHMDDELIGGCKLLPNVEIWDQVKSCGINCEY